MTQEDLVHGLYAFDDTVFRGLDTTTISKWERGITQPKVAKQISILHYFQHVSSMAFPALTQKSVQQTETLICRMGIENLMLEKSHELVLNFPDTFMDSKHLHVGHIRHAPNVDALLELAADLRNANNPPLTQVTLLQMEAWAEHPSNLFLVCTYKKVVTGFLFSLRLKPDVLQEILHFRKAVGEIDIEEIASFDEEGSLFPIAFFSLNKKSASMLFLRYYAHLIANQHRIVSIGTTAALEEAKKIIIQMNLQPVAHYEAEGILVDAYEASLFDALASENVIRLILRREKCPEE
jgi:hypothetical protein